ncbi:MAG: bifunctional sulfate adenylyltransferase/adenylylsulfate kinase [Deltaproteobacteria bacterium]|nr:bifunctional sulfate adenylyltransferase/adenylylsulfate kinase [Deltaproteobacteria bacterium]MBW1921933.1 bifunctional sulfate adenylyltransferase/adenylylsulfate kinase [Deltaproteobacteria bacterium]MBW1948799.1 bifunctional sulfate adenylyltransferase/adenylylsulfate kinase [Deltaproteobacteria bacterium]MBW2006476.1 bifunctional sulfate adenylyltransferase/adenylylsulfate kinase [Deltaproteobacteria bacterium]MBW2101172.1 bifunctional sulfate adenylyltransferase/adenylylsulfate kinase 
MKHVALTEPYGGSLVDRSVDADRAALLKEIALSLPDITLNERQLCDLELISTGVFSPLQGFMTRPDYESVLDRMRLQSGLLWPLPVCLHISETTARGLEAGQSVCLRDPEGFLLAVMHVEDLWPAEPEKEAERVYGTQDPAHPGVAYLKGMGPAFYMGGRVEVLSLPLHFDFKQLRLTPPEIRSFYRRLGWHRVVGFQTRNPIHRAQFEMTLEAMRRAKANLLLLPLAGTTGPGDFDHYTRARCYRAVVKHYPPDSFLLNLLPLAARMAGPREALLHMIIARNYGCTHFIVGRDHASPGADGGGRPFYGKEEACVLAERYAEEIGVEVVPFKEMVYLPFEDEYRTLDRVPQGLQTISLSGSDIRRRIRAGRKVPEWATFPEVVSELRRAYPSPQRQGFTVFLTGLSGAGKSTIARVLYSRFLEMGDRPVTLLDGDIVRRNLSSELGFSKEHRDINVRRIGFVAGEITKNRGIAICAPIAPYAATRREVRSEIENYGGFVEVHVSTPVEECEKRDRKGMYAKARAGLIKGFTGVDDPYEVPENPEVRIDTTDISPEEAAQEIMLFLGQKGYL